MNEWQRRIMALVCRHPGMWTVALIAERYAMSPRLARSRVQSLRRTGYLRRRVHALRPTQAGRLAFEATQ